MARTRCEQTDGHGDSYIPPNFVSGGYNKKRVDYRARNSCFETRKMQAEIQFCELKI